MVRSPLGPSTGFGIEQGLTESLLNEYTTERTPSVSPKDKALRAEESNRRLGQVTFPGLPATARIHHFQQVLGKQKVYIRKVCSIGRFPQISGSCLSEIDAQYVPVPGPLHFPFPVLNTFSSPFVFTSAIKLPRR